MKVTPKIASMEVVKTVMSPYSSSNIRETGKVTSDPRQRASNVLWCARHSSLQSTFSRSPSRRSPYGVRSALHRVMMLSVSAPLQRGHADLGPLLESLPHTAQ